MSEHLREVHRAVVSHLLDGEEHDVIAMRRAINQSSNHSHGKIAAATGELISADLVLKVKGRDVIRINPEYEPLLRRFARK